jgi:hypothetical protein
LKYEPMSRRLPDLPEDLSLETFAEPSELRDAHNFASKAQPIADLPVQAPAPTLSLDRQFERQALAANLSQTSARLPGKPREAGILSEARHAEVRHREPDPPFRAPSSWLTPQPSDNSEWSWNWSERSTAAFLGFAAGVLVIVPLVIIISLTSGPAPAPVANVLGEAKISSSSSAPGSKISANAIAVGSVSSSQWFDKSIPAKASGAVSAALSKASSALEAGRIAEARAILRQAASPERAQLWFVLAETYDPQSGNRWQGRAGTTDNLRKADIQFARYYYQQALTYGVEAARARLEALPQP